jgi:hypothetical protein
MRLFLAIAVALAGALLAGANELGMRDPLEYPNMLSAPLGKFLKERSLANSRASIPRRAVFGGNILALGVQRVFIVFCYTGYNPMQSGALRQGRIPRRYIVRMKKHAGKDIDSAVLRWEDSQQAAGYTLEH